MLGLFVLTLIFAAYGLAHAQSSITSTGNGSIVVKRGSANVDTTLPMADTVAKILESCNQRILQEQTKLYGTSTKPVKTSYFCNMSIGIAALWTPAADPPKPTDPALYTQNVKCAAPQVGSFDQKRDYVLTTTATGKVWNPTPWLPLVAPAGACTTPTASFMPSVDPAKLPVAAVGFNGPRVQTAPYPFNSFASAATADLPALPIGPQAPNPSDIGAFRLGCQRSHFAWNDPIVYPGQPNKSHLHVFWGNTGADANSTVDSIKNTGNSTCSGGTLVRTAYWAPAMIDTTDGLNVPVDTSGILVYYKTGYGGVKPAAVRAIPPGLRFISGNSAGTPSNPSGAGRFSCVGGNTGVGWQTTIPANCNTWNSLIMEVSFPQCWDGVNLDSPDHKSHMHEATGSGCPSSHPVPIPAIAYEIYYDLSKVKIANMKNWRLASDNYANTSPGGYSSHGDYFWGWDVATFAKVINNCDNPSVDCHTNLLGDGNWLY